MKKIYSIKERIIYTLLIIVLGLFQLTLLLNYIDNTAIVIIAYTCVVVVVTLLIKLFAIPYHIVINNNRMKVYDFPLLATNKFYDKKRSLILWNSEIDINEIKSVELVKLTKEQKMKYIGYIHLFDRYIKVSLNNSNSNKYIYVYVYSKSQIRQIIKALTKNNT
ncbi:MAG: hypothetical protein IJB13_02565 [Clostridia bacterium]|nr:hypothetical protein [Clostridia bacterium]MBQ6884021.1 hypothetical protein [Clostridia bacterium]